MTRSHSQPDPEPSSSEEEPSEQTSPPADARADEGPADEGPADEGPADEGPADDGPAASRPTIHEQPEDKVATPVAAADTTSNPIDTPAIPGEPLPFHLALRDYFQKADSAVWDWFAPQTGHNTAEDSAQQQTRRELLKTAYRLDQESEADVYQLAERLRDRMGLTAPVTLYQAQNVSDCTAFNVWVPGELHVVFGGPLRDILTENELAAVICHEFAHYELFEIEDGDIYRVDRILCGMAADCAADSPHIRTLRSFRLWTELYCDRRGAQILDGIDDCVTALVKVETGLAEVSAAAYRRQAQEVLAAGPLTSEGFTHPETFIRAYALDCWAADPAAAHDRIAPLVAGPLALKTLDLLQQSQLVEFTWQFVRCFLNEPWLQSRLMLHHAQRFLDPAAAADEPLKITTVSITDAHWEQMKTQVDSFDADLKRYLCYILLDFITCDADLEEGPLAAAFLMCDQLDLSAQFRDLVRKELKLGKRALQTVESSAEKIVRRMSDEVPA